MPRKMNLTAVKISLVIYEKELSRKSRKNDIPFMSFLRLSL